MESESNSCESVAASSSESEPESGILISNVKFCLSYAA